MSNNTQTQATPITLANALVYNNRFATQRISANQIGNESYADWKTLMTNLHRVSYSIYAHCENNGLKAQDTSVDKSPIYDIAKAVLKSFGKVNGHPLFVNEEMAIAIIGYAGKRGNVDAPELKLVLTQISNAKKELRLYQETNGVNTDAIAELETRIADLETKKADLLATADMRYKQPTMTTYGAFSLDVEHLFARAISGQQAKSLAELDAEKEARKQAQKEKRAANKKASK